jgi:hypothetical protein
MSDPKPTSPNASRKYALKVTLPDGKDYVFTRVENKLALIPVIGNTVEGRFLGFDTPMQVKEFLKEIRTKYPEEFEKIWKMRPNYMAVDVVH